MVDTFNIKNTLDLQSTFKCCFNIESSTLKNCRSTLQPEFSYSSTLKQLLSLLRWINNWSFWKTYFHIRACFFFRFWLVIWKVTHQNIAGSIDEDKYISSYGIRDRINAFPGFGVNFKREYSDVFLTYSLAVVNRLW